MVGHHQAADPVGRGQVRRPPGQGHLDAGGTPGDEAGQFTLPDPLEAFVDLKEPQRSGGSTSQLKSPRGQNFFWVFISTCVGSTSPWMMLRMAM